MGSCKWTSWKRGSALMTSMALATAVRCAAFMGLVATASWRDSMDVERRASLAGYTSALPLFLTLGREGAAKRSKLFKSSGSELNLILRGLDLN